MVVQESEFSIFPTAYLPPVSYIRQIKDLQQGGKTVFIEVQETFEKQTFRNRCVVQTAHHQKIGLTVPVIKCEHKQLTQDVQIAYYQPWQHHHWQTLRSLYEKSPYFMYYQDFFHPFYVKKYKWLVDLNEGLLQTILSLLANQIPNGLQKFSSTVEWSGQLWTDKHTWQTELSIMDSLFELGPTTLL